MVAQIAAKISHEPNLARSAMAPETSATVRIANVAWKATKASGGYAAPSGTSMRAASPMLFQSIAHGATRPSEPGKAIA